MKPSISKDEYEEKIKGFRVLSPYMHDCIAYIFLSVHHMQGWTKTFIRFFSS